jgi:site-specific DNA recombinase
MKAAIYARYSSDNQREESIDAQLRAIREYAAREGHTIVRVYADEARSATTDQREHFQQMIADAAAGIFECVIVHKLDRFARDRYDSAFYKRQLKQHGVRLISVLENIDDSPESIILESVLEGMAEYYSRNLAREVMKGLKETAYQCKHTGGKPPLGYDVMPDKTYAVNPIEAEAVRLIFDMYASGAGYAAILDALNARGCCTKRGQRFGRNSLYNILSNEKYAGVFVFNRTERKIAGKRNGHRSKSDEEIIRVEGGIPAIISRATWEKVKCKMEKNKHAQASYKARTVYLLSGKIFCGRCGGAMLGKHGKMGRAGKDYGYYECGTRKRTKACTAKAINRDVVEKLVIDALYDSLFAPDAIDPAADRIYQHAASHRSEIPEYLRAARKQLAGVEIEIKNIVDAIAKGMFHESMKIRMDELEASKAALALRIEEAQFQDAAHSLTRDQIRQYLGRFTGIKEMSPQFTMTM